VANLGRRLQELRAKAGVSQSQLARASGVPVATLQGYEQGRRHPLWYVLFKLASALGVSSEAFADCRPGREPPPARRSKTARARGRKK
jgi:transcriptional regulator with XRE-family HTH domain